MTEAMKTSPKLSHYARGAITLCFSACFALVAVDAFAQSGVLVVVDSAGVERAKASVESASKIEFSLTDASGAPAEGAEITLTNELGVAISTQSVNGIAVFEGVGPGTWTVASITPGITFTDINLGALSALTTTSLGALSTATVAGGALAVGATTVGIVAIADDSSDKDPLSPAS
jgi:hypothetical protein